jgi:ribosomal protein L2
MSDDDFCDFLLFTRRRRTTTNGPRVEHRAMLHSARLFLPCSIPPGLSRQIHWRALKPVTETSPFKTFKPITPSLRHVRLPYNPHLHKGRPHLPLTYPYRSTGGRNNEGKLTVRGRGGGHKRRIRIIDSKRQNWPKDGAEVVRIERDPGRGGHIALVRLLRPPAEERPGTTPPKPEMRYILATLGMRAGDKVNMYPDAKPATDDPEDLESIELQRAQVADGNTLPLGSIPFGTTIHNISTKIGGPATLVKGAGTKATVVGVSKKGIQVCFFWLWGVGCVFENRGAELTVFGDSGQASIQGDPVYPPEMYRYNRHRVESAS